MTDGGHAPALRARVERVVARDNCCGCGACATLSGSINMELDRRGDLRPVWRGDEVTVAHAAERFAAICPGVAVTAAREPGAQVHPTLGPFVSAWTAWSTDAGVRFAGSSGGVLTSLSSWMLESGVASSVVGAAMDEATPSRTVALRLRTREEVLATAGSRYAPVANAQLFSTDDTTAAFVGKPCEVAASRRIMELDGVRPGHGPVLLSFFCAGVPSQQATDDLIRELGFDPGDVAAVRYRGNGWPGRFAVRDRLGATSDMTYERSWGAHLGPRVQARCKICPDGTGGHADIAVGDFWRTSVDGYPTFDEQDGVSVAIARTRRGHELLLAARAAGIIDLGSVSLDEVARVQPLQVKRRITLLGRLVGRLLAGERVPRYRGFRLLAHAARAPRETARTTRGAYARARRDQRRRSR